MSTITAPDTISHRTEYWDTLQHAWLPCGDGGYGTLADVPTTLEQARAEAAGAWDTYIRDWVREGDTYEDEDGAPASYRIVWDGAGAEDPDEHLATVEIDVVRDDDGYVIGYELGAVELYQP